MKPVCGVYALDFVNGNRADRFASEGSRPRVGAKRVAALANPHAVRKVATIPRRAHARETLESRWSNRVADPEFLLGGDISALDRLDSRSLYRQRREP